MIWINGLFLDTFAYQKQTEGPLSGMYKMFWRINKKAPHILWAALGKPLCFMDVYVFDKAVNAVKKIFIIDFLQHFENLLYSFGCTCDVIYLFHM